MPYGSVYTYGGTWRCDWLRQYFARADAAGPVDASTFKMLPLHADRGTAMGRGSNSQTDRAAREILPYWIPFLSPEDPVYAEVIELVAGYDGGAWPLENNGVDMDDSFVFVNAWLFAVIRKVFGAVFSPGTPRFSIGAVGQAGLPNSAPNQRFAAMIALLSDPEGSTLLKHDWLDGRVWEDVVLSALDATLETLPLTERPWGDGLRNRASLRPVGTGLPDPLATHPAGQSPSLIALVEFSHCGPVRADSSVNFGVSGEVLNANGDPSFQPHTRDQLEIWIDLDTKPAPRLFGKTLACLARRQLNNATIVH